MLCGLYVIRTPPPLKSVQLKLWKSWNFFTTLRARARACVCVCVCELLLLLRMLFVVQQVAAVVGLFLHSFALVWPPLVHHIGAGGGKPRLPVEDRVEDLDMEATLVLRTETCHGIPQNLGKDRKRNRVVLQQVAAQNREDLVDVLVSVPDDEPRELFAVGLARQFVLELHTLAHTHITHKPHTHTRSNLTRTSTRLKTRFCTSNQHRATIQLLLFSLPPST